MMTGFGTMGALGEWWMLLGTMAGLALLALLVWGAVAVAAGAQQSRETDTPLEILKKRYAAGEISQAEFEIAKKGLVDA
jgi:uncharacterized membrane protein